MGKPEIEIMPPLPATVRQSNVAAQELSYPIAPVNPGGMVSSALTRWEANRHTRVFDALTSRTQAEAVYFDAQCGAIDSYIKRARAAHQLAELPDMLAADRARRSAQRADELREFQHRRELADNRRRTELAQVQVVLVDAEQALRAQREFGFSNYELAWKKRNYEMLEIELSATERRALMEQHVAELKAPVKTESGDPIDDALYEKRAQLNASGLDTSRIDAELERRRAGKNSG